mmetsp:Transcript_26935/g.48945  ORF Transcript_26935/g.48945 Transcript_26935/m.48945 type:complete len:199 (+) Transcript_26935:1688-2284(+)
MWSFTATCHRKVLPQMVYSIHTASLLHALAHKCNAVAHSESDCSAALPSWGKCQMPGQLRHCKNGSSACWQMRSTRFATAATSRLPYGHQALSALSAFQPTPGMLAIVSDRCWGQMHHLQGLVSKCMRTRSDRYNATFVAAFQAAKACLHVIASARCTRILCPMKAAPNLFAPKSLLTSHVCPIRPTLDTSASAFIQD